MSNIPTPQIVAEGYLPSVEEKSVFTHELMEQFSTDEVQLVLYGSLARGDATLRSDIDLCATPHGEEYISSSFNSRELERWVNEEIARRGWNTTLSVLNCASKRGDAEHNRNRFADPSGPIEEMRFSITTFDHFGYLSRDSRFPSEIRRCYAAIQQDIRKYTGTNKEARLRDLANYVARSIQWPGRYLLPIRWREDPDDLAHLGWAENVAYHVLRKLGGITKTLKGSDAKASLAGCFESRGQVVDELLHHFWIIRHFGFDIEEVLARTYGRPEHIGEYETFLDQRLPGMAKAAMAMLNLLHREIEEKTLLETVADYDRQQPKTVILADRFLPWLEGRQKEGVCTAVHWWCVGDKVYVDAPLQAYVEYKGETRVFASAHFEGKKLNSHFVTAEGRVEICFGPHPRPDRPYIYTRPTRKDRSDYQQAAGLAQNAVLAKLREILPTDISIIAPSLTIPKMINSIEEVMIVKIQKINPKAITPRYAHPGDAGLDLYSLENHVLKPNEHHVFELGFALEFPKGYTALIWDKGGMAVKNGIHVIGGVFDAGFRGEYKIKLVNLSKSTYKIEDGDKIAQMLIQPVAQARLKVTQELSETSRADGAFGSTGRK